MWVTCAAWPSFCLSKVFFHLCCVAPVVTLPCSPSPCGPNSQCREINGQAVCSCVPGFMGSPPACRPECVVSSECGQNEACSNQRCRNPCPGTCGVGARCEVVNHNPICSCPARFTGDPFVRCQPIRKKSLLHIGFVFCFLPSSVALVTDDTFSEIELHF